MERRDLQRLSHMRQHEANVLLDTGHWAGAYNLIGYAVECALKACIAKQIPQHTVPERKPINDFYTHDLERLLSLTPVKATLLAERQRELNSEQYRCELMVTAIQAQDLYVACTRRKDGVLPWLRKHWYGGPSKNRSRGR